jgi:anthranilate phosphoribosyltransferase
MKYAIGPRREIAVRTIFNILGPLTNPAGASRQLMGVFAADMTDLLAHVLSALGSKAALVVSGYGGLDELTTTGPNHVSHLSNGKVNTYDFNPEDFGFKGAHISELLGDGPDVNAQILRGILSGNIQDSRRDVVVLNAAAAFIAAELANDFPTGVTLANKIIDSGAAREKLDALISYSQQFKN